MSTQIFSVIIRIIAIILFVIGLYQLSDNFYFLFTFLKEDIPFQIIYLFLFGFTLVAAALLWIFSNKIAQGLLHNIVEGKKLADTTIIEIQTAAISIVGIIFIVFTLDRILSITIFLYRNRVDMDIQTELLFSLIIAGVNIGIGLWLVFGSKGLVILMDRIRNAGLDK